MHLPEKTDLRGETLREIAFPDEKNRYYSYREYLRPGARFWKDEELRRFVRENIKALQPYGGDGEPADDKDVDDIVIGRHAYGATFAFEDVEVDVLAYWDGDGTLLFRIRKGEEVLDTVVNHDSKKDHGWQ